MAIFEQDKVLYEEASNGDKTIIMPVTRANNVEGLGRSANTKFVAGEVVYVDNNKKIALKCTTAGTTSNTELDISGNNVGDTVTDGTVVWQVCNRTSDVTSVNGKTGDVVVDVGVASVNNKTGVVTLKESPSDMTDYIIESYRNGTEWYEVYKSGKVRQGGLVSDTSNGTKTVALLKPMADNKYKVLTNAAGDAETQYAWGQVNSKTTTSFKVLTSNKTDWEVEGQGA